VKFADDTKSKEKNGKNWVDWLKEGTFYIHGFVYIFTRMAINLTYIMWPFYLQLVTGFGKTGCPICNATTGAIALVPLISCAMAFLFSVFG